MGRVVGVQRQPGGVAHRLSVLKRLPDRFHNAVQVLVQLRVPEPQSAEAFARQHRITDHITTGPVCFAMLTAVDFDHQPLAKAREVEIVASKRRLPSEMEATVPEHPKPLP